MKPTTTIQKCRRDNDMHSQDQAIPEEDILVLGSSEVSMLLSGQESEIIRRMEMAYRLHGRGDSSLPHSVFLRFPENERDRIIALPGYLGGEVNSAGVKWIGSFPGNIQRGIERASALLILNSMTTGRPKAVLEGSLISAKRTAASAALAAGILHGNRKGIAGFIGCGPINLEIFGFLRSKCPAVDRFILYDLSGERAERFKEQCERQFAGVDVQIGRQLDDLFRDATLLSFATTATTPYVNSFDRCSPGTVVLNISLRDLSPEVILSSENIVDDVNHVCREGTSIHRTEQVTGHRRFIRCTLADLLEGKAALDQNGLRRIFSPFGLGILDIALGEYVFQLALEKGRGTYLHSFLPV
jgi:ornithine cyclodeaminase